MSINSISLQFINNIVSDNDQYNTAYASYSLGSYEGSQVTLEKLRTWIKSQGRPFSYMTEDNGSLIIVSDEDDTYAVWALNECLESFTGESISSTTELIAAYNAKIRNDYLVESDLQNLPAIRANFHSNLYFADSDASLTEYANKAARRLNIHRQIFVSGSSQDPEDEEIIVVSEDENNTDTIDSLYDDGYQNLLYVWNKAFGEVTNEKEHFDEIRKLAFGDNRYSRDISVAQLNKFYRVFSKIEISKLDTLSSDNLLNIVDKITEIGLFELAGYANEISAFAARRASSISSLQKSAEEFVDSSADAGWLAILSDISAAIMRDPIFFANLIYYFPSLITFFIDTMAIVGDYSPSNEEVDITSIIDSLEKAFGMYGGQQVFQLASSITNTTQRIRNALGITSTNPDPFRPNIPPVNPDIFHLRIGAANFYVPPVTIDVNSSFKAGSLMTGAIRQKNSPKFNSGYKETTVRMRLFFPNYEEIWGMKVYDGSNLKLDEDYVIDFKPSGSSDEKIDKFLSSLRGLIAAFKYSPFLPIKNQYLNTVHGITAVGMSSMSISTIPNFPFALAVDLELVNFNHKPFLPMLSDFNQAIHWGKYREYMGKASISLNEYVNESFLLKTSDIKEIDSTITEVIAPAREVIWNGFEYRPVGNSPETLDSPDQQNEDNGDTSTSEVKVLNQNVIEDWTNGNHLTLFIPAEAQTKLFLPSMSSFRSDEEKIMTDLGRATWQSLLFDIGIDINESAGYGLSLSETVDISRENAYTKSIKNIILDSINILLAGLNSSSDAEATYDYLTTNFIIENKKYFDDSKPEDVIKKEWLKDKYDNSRPYTPIEQYIFQGKFINKVSLNSIKEAFIDISTDPKEYLNYLVDTIISDQVERNGSQNAPDTEKVKQEVTKAFNVALYERFFQSGPIQSLMEAARARAGAYQFNEWEVPMLRVDLDPESVIINGVSVSLGNNLVKLQVQMQDEPTYQHIGGRDSYINISMTVIGEKELMKFKKIFDHITGLARLEHATGVIGFLGIKNIITALSGIKYVMPLNYSVNTRPNFPHIYDVEISLVDFDIFQQKREEISSKHQQELVDSFKTKKNPFLRIKQLWGSFNAYPDFPLHVKNSSNEIVGCLDPDYYFRSFQMFDDDVINHIGYQQDRLNNFAFNNSFGGDEYKEKIQLIKESITEFTRQYATIIDRAAATEIVEEINSLVQSMLDFLQDNNITKEMFYRIFTSTIANNPSDPDRNISIELLTDFIEFEEPNDENSQFLYREVQPAPYQVGSISPNQLTLLASIEAALEGRYSLENEEYVSFHPDEVDFHKQIFAVPAADPESLKENRIPSILTTALGTYYGYIDRVSGRFYLTIAGNNVKKTDIEDGSYTFAPNQVEDTQTPDRGTTNPLTGARGTTALSEYQKAYSGNPATHWEKMLVDTKYRDISGRMIRAFPTYMLWLIDEGGYFAGVKLFDNFYGLQSIIDFSVVSSEDLLGDTLILRVSNLYSKLTKKESTKLFSTSQDDYVNDDLSLTEGLSGIIDRTLNMNRNIKSGMRNDYIVDIRNIRLKPGVRVHLRAGYGANPNSLQTVFNGVITNVEQGEIVTVTAQSDAIELGAVVNSTNKKGDSGKIDGGIDTGMYLSEPRDLMVRLLTMGSSRTREAIAHATRGTVFSENRFGIRHFGNILYEPLNEEEKARNDAVREKVQFAYQRTSGDKSVDVNGFSFNVRGGTLSVIGQLWSNFATQVDLEIFKRNIYPGNGLGIAQFLGGDLDDGWSTVASLVPDQQYIDNIDNSYLNRLSDSTYNRLLQDYQNKDVDAKATLDKLTFDNRLVENNRAGLTKGALSLAGLAIGAIAMPTLPIAGTILAGTSLLGVLSGRGGENVFRAMGLISPNMDDDLPGFDEVSFRAQTYMRTVWDLFQTCARLLPNYIVAVRPFEDRSTIFYGKPHWLYTSGVVPVTTGFPGEERAQELGIIAPKTVEPDTVLQEMLNTINKNSNPLSDYSAYFQAYEPNENFMAVAQQINTSSGIYAPSTFFAGKIINFFSSRSNSFVDPVEGVEVIAKLPTSYGFVDVGPHLPIIGKNYLNEQNTEESTTVGLLSRQQGLHKEIGNLPPRFRFPYFTVTENVSLEASSRFEVYPAWWHNDYVAFGGEDSGNPQLEYSQHLEFLALEISFFGDTKYSLAPNLGEDFFTDTNPDNLDEDNAIMNLDMPLDFSQLLSLTRENISFTDEFIKMPLPNVNIPFNEAFAGYESGEYSFEFSENNFGELTYAEWGAPETAEDEQFYIAMRWPYNPIGDNVQLDDQSLNEFKQKYGFENLYGSVEDYKSRKILVYNPANNRAVVCKPAYFLWGEDDLKEREYENYNLDTVSDFSGSIDARVSPDAAYFLGILVSTDQELREYSRIDSGNPFNIVGESWISEDQISNDIQNIAISSGYRFVPRPQRCLFSFVPDYVPVGVLSTTVSKVNKFKTVKNVQRDETNQVTEYSINEPEEGTFNVNYEITGVDGSEIATVAQEEYIIGFGGFQFNGEDSEFLAQRLDVSGRREANDSPNNPFITYGLFNTESTSMLDLFDYGGNPLNIEENTSYFQAVIDSNYSILAKDKLNDILEQEEESGLSTSARFIPVWDPADIISIQARQYWDENYDPAVSVIAGTGRTLVQAMDIWNTFRAEYHNYDSVKKIFFDIYGISPDSEDQFPPLFKAILSSSISQETGLELFRNSGDPSAVDEFAILLGSDYVRNTDVEDTNNPDREKAEAIEFMRRNMIDADIDEGGLVQTYNALLRSNFSKISKTFFADENIAFLDFLVEQDTEDPVSIPNLLLEKINSPKQLFLLIVGIFRQRMWEDPYARAWLVLKPDKKPGWWGASGWSFKPVDPIFREFINPYNDYAKPSKKAKFLQLLVSTKSEGNESDTYYEEAVDDIGAFVNKTIGPIFRGIGDALTGLLSMFKLSMQQLGYGLSELANFKKQANILNKVLNDSIYYSLGRPGSILRAVDNPFTREYGEPVVEIREPFQRLHYISSFSHILSNQIQENLNGVATVITAVSDGKYPVSVALDKGAPAERQVENTVETGIIFDNFAGSGMLTGFLHPFMHPLETFRGIAKNIQGTPDELSARRIALAHLKESIKDIYGGELIIIGNADIRPHDLIYLSDVYERMYGIFEVEQVVHHFTPELGFITSITPNALVTVNDPARWFMTSWMQSWMHVQNVRNDVRIYIDNIRNANSVISSGGNVSIDRLGEVLSTQLVGGLQYTHGSSALLKDIMASETAKTMPSANQAALAAEAAKGEEVGGVPKFAAMTSMIPLVGPLAWGAWKWVRDNVLDQHGCYVQYLNKNGQPMDAGLSYNQGMVVGQHHSKSLLPGILGVRRKARTPEGNAFIRTDDLFKSLGWSETQISEVTRYISYESALVHARVLNLAGLGPERAGFDWQFRVICKVVDVLDGDTIDVQDVISGANFRIRFDGINTSEINEISGKLDYPDTNTPTNLSILDISTPGGMAKIYVSNAIKNKVIVVRVNQTRTNTSTDSRAVLESDYEAGSIRNNIQNYQLDIFGRSADGFIDSGNSTPRALGTIFHNASPEALQSSKIYISNIFRQNITELDNIKNYVKNEFYDSSPFYLKFNEIYNAINDTVGKEYYGILDATDVLFTISEDQKQIYSTLVYMKMLEEIYNVASSWPRTEWDQYYNDGTPITLNWELVVNNLARVYIKDLQKESESVQTVPESLPF